MEGVGISNIAFPCIITMTYWLNHKQRNKEKSALFELKS